jgi:phosphatidylinositol glycan class F
LNNLFKIKPSIKIIPLHIILIVYFMFTQADLEHELEATLMKGIYALIATQGVYTALLLSQVYSTKTKKTGKGAVKKFSVSGDYHNLLFGVIGTLVLSVVVFVAVVLFGAPLFTVWENYVLAVHLSLLVYPVVVLVLKIGLNEVSFKTATSVVVGAWVGAAAIPLDWDRPWQVWPMPIVGGGYVGAVVGYCACWLW